MFDIMISGILSMANIIELEGQGDTLISWIVRLRGEELEKVFMFDIMDSGIL